jgi:transcriptional regulator with XRE-family HTH domain
MKDLEVNRAFAKNLKALREQHNLSLRILAEEIGISYQALNYYENCQRDPSITIVKKIADYFSKTVDEMIGE